MVRDQALLVVTVPHDGGSTPMTRVDTGADLVPQVEPMEVNHAIGVC
jgi:hypothetical protein